MDDIICWLGKNPSRSNRPGSSSIYIPDRGITLSSIRVLALPGAFHVMMAFCTTWDDCAVHYTYSATYY